MTLFLIRLANLDAGGQKRLALISAIDVTQEELSWRQILLTACPSGLLGQT